MGATMPLFHVTGLDRKPGAIEAGKPFSIHVEARTIFQASGKAKTNRYNAGRDRVVIHSMKEVSRSQEALV